MAGVIAIDGETAAGKTAVGRELARRLGCPFLDTGIMYRAITWLARRRGVAMDDEPALGRLAREAALGPPVTGEDGNMGNTILLDGQPLGPELRAPEIDAHVSLVSAVPAVRRELVLQQREMAATAGDMVMVGRDIGTVVLPDADLKVYLTASPEVRARRRHADLLAQGHAADLAQVLQDTRRRDRIDSQRQDSPLARADDALLLCTDNLTIDQAVETIREAALARAGQTRP